MGVDAIGQLGVAVVGLDGPDREVTVDGDVQAAANECRQRAGRVGRRAGVVGKRRVEAVYQADQTLCEWCIAVEAMGVVSESGTRGDEDQRQRLPRYVRAARELTG